MIWTRRQFLTGSSISVVAGALGGLRLSGQQPPATTAFAPLRENVGIFTGRGGTIGWLVTPEAVVVIDSQFPDTATVCLDGLNERSHHRPVDFLINTHHHGDHTAGNVVFRKAAKKIVAHVKVPELQRMQAAAQGTEADQAYADTTFADTWKADLGSETVSAKHYGPAHTSGDIAVCFEHANVVHLGDLVFNRRHPFIDRPAGALISGWITVLEQIAAEHSQDTLFIYGHAKEGLKVTGTRADLLYQRDYFTALLDHVRAEIKAGKSRDDISKATSELTGFADHGPLIERVLSVAYDELTG